MYIDPNTGGILFQLLSCLTCLAPVAAVGGVIAGIVYFIKKGKKNPQSDSTKDSTS